MATRFDMEWPGTTGKRPFGFGAELRLGVALVRAAAEYPDVMRLLGPVYQLVASPLTLLNPELLLRVGYAELRRRLGDELLLTSNLDAANGWPAANT